MKPKVPLLIKKLLFKINDFPWSRSVDAEYSSIAAMMGASALGSGVLTGKGCLENCDFLPTL